MKYIRLLWDVFSVGRVRTKPLTQTEQAAIRATMERLLPPEEIARMDAARASINFHKE